MLLEMTQASFGYHARRVVAVEKLHLSARRCLGVYGPNGSGKSTLVRGMIGLLAPMSGSVQRSRPLRFGYLQQHRTLDTHWPMTGLDAASIALSATKRFGFPGADIAKVHHAMTLLNVDGLADAPFSKLSGGQQQRLLLAGALATAPDILLLDEPCDGLDARSRQSLLELLKSQSSHGLCTVLISHEVRDLLQLADQIAWLHRSDETDQPSQVECIAPDELAHRVTQARSGVIR